MIKEEKLKQAAEQYVIDVAYGSNRYLTNDLIHFATSEAAREYWIDKIVNYIKNDSEIAIPIERFFDSEGNHITKKEYGKIVLEILCSELNQQKNSTKNL